MKGSLQGQKLLPIQHFGFLLIRSSAIESRPNFCLKGIFDGRSNILQPMGNFQHPSMLPSIPEAQMAFVVWSVILAGLSTEDFYQIKK
jgi:hypothetical protein